MNSLGPKYIYDLLLRYEPSRPLRWSGTGLLTVPRVTTKHREAAFSFYAPYTLTNFQKAFPKNSNFSHFF